MGYVIYKWIQFRRWRYVIMESCPAICIMYAEDLNKFVCPWYFIPEEGNRNRWVSNATGCPVVKALHDLPSSQTIAIYSMVQTSFPANIHQRLLFQKWTSDTFTSMPSIRPKVAVLRLKERFYYFILLYIVYIYQSLQSKFSHKNRIYFGLLWRHGWLFVFFINTGYFCLLAERLSA